MIKFKDLCMAYNESYQAARSYVLENESFVSQLIDGFTEYAEIPKYYNSPSQNGKETSYITYYSCFEEEEPILEENLRNSLYHFYDGRFVFSFGVALATNERLTPKNIYRLKILGKRSEQMAILEFPNGDTVKCNFDATDLKEVYDKIIKNLLDELLIRPGSHHRNTIIGVRITQVGPVN